MVGADAAERMRTPFFLAAASELSAFYLFYGKFARAKTPAVYQSFKNGRSHNNSCGLRPYLPDSSGAVPTSGF